MRRNKRKPKRVQVHVVAVDTQMGRPYWAIHVGGVEGDPQPITRREANFQAARVGHLLGNTLGVPVEVVPHNVDGSISKSGHASYPRSSDPRRSRG